MSNPLDKAPMESEPPNVAELKKRIAAQDKIIEAQRKRLEAKAPKLALPAKSKPSGKGKTVRAICGDTHGCFADSKALKAFLADLKAIKPTEIVLGGDHLDCAGWQAEHQPFATVQEARYSFSEDVAACNSFLDTVQSIAPRATIHYLEGNHEERVEKKCVKMTMQHPQDAAYMQELFSVEKILHLEKRGINYYRRTRIHMGLRTRGTIRLGKCYFVHGVSHAKNAGDVHLQLLKRNVVFFHVHRMIASCASDVETTHMAWCPGCLCNLEPIYLHSKPSQWSHGYAVQVAASNGMFSHRNVPIIEGRSFLE